MKSSLQTNKKGTMTSQSFSEDMARAQTKSPRIWGKLIRKWRLVGAGNGERILGFPWGDQ